MVRIASLVVAALLASGAARTTLLAPHRDPARAETTPSIEGPGPSVLEFGPSGEVQALPPTLKVRFDRDMVVAWPMGTKLAGPIFNVTPPIDGQARWLGTDLVAMAVHGHLI
jgi:hypothetical protein